MAQPAGFIPEAKCPALGVYPTVEEFNLGLGPYAIALYVYCGVVIAILAVQYGSLAGHFLTNVPSKRMMATFWVNSVYLMVALFTMFSIVLPKASSFVWLFYRVYLGMAMGYFVQLTMSWYGGETAMLEKIQGRDVIYRVRPCCCCFICPSAAPLTKRRIRFMKATVFQMPYVQGAVLFIMSVLQIAHYLEPGNVSPTGPYLYLISMLLTSFFVGIWGLFFFMDVTKRYELLVDYNYRQKSMLLKILVVLVNVQGIFVDILASYSVIGCIPPFMSSSAVAGVIKSLLSITESLIFGSLCYRLYIKSDSSHL